MRTQQFTPRGGRAPSSEGYTSALSEMRELGQKARQKQAEDHYAALCQLARRDVNTFCELVLKDERTGKGIEQAPIHERWHQLCDTHDRLVIWSHIESGKTSQLAVGRTLWLMGRDPSIRIAIISNTHEQASKIVRTIARYIEQSQELRDVFPDLKKGEPWMPSSTLFCERPVYSKDPTLQAFGVHGNVTGSRLDYVILDDVLDFENIKTSRLRQELWDWYHNVVAGRMLEGGKVLSVGVAQHPDDVQHRFVRDGHWRAERFPVLDERGRYTWPERWSPERVEAKRKELGPLEFARQMLCQARDEETALCKKEWVEAGLVAGAGRKLLHHLAELPPGSATFTGVDLAVQQHASADFTCLFTILAKADGTREVLNIETGRFAGPDIVAKILDHHSRYHSIVWVENNAAQDFIRQFASAASVELPIRGITTGRNKAHPEFGIQGIFSELSSGRWIIPARGNKEVDAWCNEMLTYDPGEHTGDRLMASWFAREGARQLMRQKQKVGLRVRSFGRAV